MKYIIDENYKLGDITSVSYEIEGLKVSPNKYSTVKSLEVKEIVITDPLLINKFVKKKIDKKFTMIFKKMYYIINSEDSSSNDAAVLLDETAKLKSIIINKYKEHITIEEYKELLKKVIVLEEQFKKMYAEKEYERLMEQEEIRGISR